jgi:signal transduction histidine kinase
VLGAQLASGLFAIWWNHAGADPAAQVSSVWLTLSLLSAVLFCMAVAAHIYLPRSGPGWLALLVSLAGLAVCINGGTLDTGDALASALHDHFQALLVLLVWQVLALLAAAAQGPEPVHDYPRIAGTGHEQLTAASAVAMERRRIAQDLHDGVASQLVGILSSLDHDMPQQQALGLALEQCLLDIKMTVDGIDCADQNVLEVLGSLRYRLRRPLDRLGITLVWNIEVCSALENIRGPAAQQVLRIAQECLSNVMRHAQASVVTVVCRFVAEAGCMEFAVSDNGVGIPPVIDADPGGWGLDNMRRRAHAIGGDLSIARTTSGGTCVQLTLPLEPEFCMVLGPDADAGTDSERTAPGIPVALRPASHLDAAVPRPEARP